MGKRNRMEEVLPKAAEDGGSKSVLPIIRDEKSIDPSLALLFTSSAGQVKLPPRNRYEELPPSIGKRKTSQNTVESDEDQPNLGSEVEEDEELSSIDEELEDTSIADFLDDEESEKEMEGLSLDEKTSLRSARKRKRKIADEDIEGIYLRKLANEEEKEEEERQAERRQKRQKITAGNPENSAQSGIASSTDTATKEDDSDSESSGSSKPPVDVPLHETLAPSTDAVELEKASRTVFLANVSTQAITSKAAKKALLTHMGSFLKSLVAPPDGKPQHKVESLRFRSTAYAGNGLPKKAAFAKKELMAATTKSTNAYVVYSTAYAARQAVSKLNGSVVLDRHLRVDGVAHPAKTDHRRCVFVGNLGFVDDETMMEQGGENERKRSKIPSDIEEGLWRQFGKAGTVESVRVVRDEKTRVGKGFAYVQFQDPNSVEAALLFNDKKYPPMLPRPLRVVRAKAVRKTTLAVQASRTRKEDPSATKNQIYKPKTTAEASSLQGRARKLLGRAGAAQIKKSAASGANGVAMGVKGSVSVKPGSRNAGIEGIKRTPESFIFEGYRATAKAGKPRDLRFGGKGGGKKKSQGKPKTRGGKRASEWRKSGGKKSA